MPNAKGAAGEAVRLPCLLCADRMRTYLRTCTGYYYGKHKLYRRPKQPCQENGASV